MKSNANMTNVSILSSEQLQQEVERLLALVSTQATTIESLRHQLNLFRHARFGRKTEKDVVHEQMVLQFDEAQASDEPELVTEVNSSDEQSETITYTRAKKGTGRKALPKSLPYIENIYDLNDEEKQCACGCTLTHIGDDVSEQLDIVPQMTFRVVNIRKKYACKGCEETIRSAKLPKQPIEKSIAAPGLISAVIDSKFNHHTPLYRLERIFADAGVPVTRATLGNWLIKAAGLLTPLVKLMEANIQEHDIAFADETPLQVLREKDRSPTSKSYMWLFIGGPPDKRAYVYQYHQTRSAQVAANFFADFNGYLHADCYSAYVALDKLAHIHHVACWAHARRYFVDVTKCSQKKTGLSHQVIKLIAELYFLEKQLKEQAATPEAIYQRRQAEAMPIIVKLKALIDENLYKILPKSPLAKAVHYLLTHWQALNRYLEDGRLEIDNNRTERSIKPFVIGRKNWLFHGNDLGAQAGSILFSLIETCKQHSINVFSWLKYVLTNIHQANTLEQLDSLLPYNINTNLLDNMRNIPELIFPDKGVVN